MILLKKVQEGSINLDEFQFPLDKDLSIEKQALLLFEMRYKGELRTASLKI
jgi:hypothetical protein